MENSMNSVNCMSKPIPPNARTVDSKEESSWTFYFEELFCHDKEEDSSYHSSGYEIPSSLVSDAASSVTKKFKDNDRDALLSLDKSRKNLMSFKKKKTKGVLADIDDLELEDTASSPANSPKVR
ncbi:hypothetical protein U1Q18_000510 [Sarracenia purpurea var. burkii]